MSGTDDPSTWAPPGLTAYDLLVERTNFNSVVLACIAYGVHVTLYLIVLNHFIRHPPQLAGSGKPKIAWGLVAYITINFVLGTFGITAQARFNQMTFIDARNHPGGPNGFVQGEYNNFINMFGTVSYVMLNWFADGLVIYRFWLIYNFNYYIALLPFLLLLGTFTMGVILLFQLSQPDANLWTYTTINFGIPYWSISAALNILVTFLIVARLMWMRQRSRAVLSGSHSRTYTSVASMLVESAALYTITAMLFIITYAQNSPIQNLVLPVLGQIQAVCPLLIMWRVALGQAITRGAMISTDLPTVSKMTWRNSRGADGLRSTASQHQNTLTPGNGGRAGGSSDTPMPVFTNKFAYDTMSKISGGDMDEDDRSELGWEMSPRGVEQKTRVEVVVERAVERWEDEPGSRDSSRTV